MNSVNVGWTGPVSPKRYGGIVYGEQSRKAISKGNTIDVVDVSAKYFRNRYLRTLESVWRLSKLEGKKDLWIRDFFSTITLPFDRTGGKNIVIVHHMGFFTWPLVAQIPYYFLEKIFYHNAKKLDAIITIAKYGEQQFLERGYKNIYKIYCGFNVASFDISDQEVADFKEKYNLKSRPIVYLGNCQEAKGVVDAYHALKGLDAHLVTSGEEQVKIPARNFNLTYREYLTLLKASSVALIMFKIPEGWCITAHEAMLLKTPVIGSPLGALTELLGEGGQIICKDFNQLPAKVEYVLNNPRVAKKMGEDGYNYGKQFTQERFENAWLDVIKKVTQQ